MSPPLEKHRSIISNAINNTRVNGIPIQKKASQGDVSGVLQEAWQTTLDGMLRLHGRRSPPIQDAGASINRPSHEEDHPSVN